MRWNLSTRRRTVSQFAVAGIAATLTSGMLCTGVTMAQPQHDAFDKVMGYDSGREETAAHNYLDQTGRGDAYGESQDQDQYQDQYNGPNSRRRAYDQTQSGARNDNSRYYQPGTNGQNRSAQADSQALSTDRSRANSSSQNRGNSGSLAANRLGVRWSMSDGRLKAERVNTSGELAQEGLERGDQIVSVGGRRVHSEAELHQALSSTEAGQEVPIVVSRNGRRQTLFWAAPAQQAVYNQRQQSTAGHHPSDAQHSAYHQNLAGQNRQADNRESNGQQRESGYVDELAMSEFDFMVKPQLTQGPRGKAFLGVQLDRNHGDRAYISHIYPHSPAEKAGLQPGDVILAVNGHQVGAPDGLTAQLSQLKPGQRVELAVDRTDVREWQGQFPEQSSGQTQDDRAADQTTRDTSYRHSSDVGSGSENSPED